MAKKEVSVKAHARRTKSGVVMVKQHTSLKDSSDKINMIKKVKEKFDTSSRAKKLVGYQNSLQQIVDDENRDKLLDKYFGQNSRMYVKVGGASVPGNDMHLKIMLDSKWKNLSVIKDGEKKTIKRIDLTPLEWAELIRQSKPIVGWSIRNLEDKLGKNFDSEMKENLRSAGISAIMEAADNYHEKYDPKNPEDFSNTLFSQIRGRVGSEYRKLDTSMIRDIPMNKVKHLSEFKKYFLENGGDMEEIYKKMALKKKDVYNDLRGKEEGEELLPMEGYLSSSREKSFSKKVKQYEDRLSKENDSFKKIVENLKLRKDGKVNEEDSKILESGLKSINGNIASHSIILQTMKSQEGTRPGELAKLRYQIKVLKENAERIKNELTPLSDGEFKEAYNKLKGQHLERLDMINSYYHEQFEKSRIAGFKDLYNVLTDAMSYRSFSLDNFIDDDEGGGSKIEEILKLPGNPSPEDRMVLKESHIENIARFKSYLAFLNPFSQKVVQLHLGLDMHSDFSEGDFWGQPLKGGKEITERIDKLIEEGRISKEFWAKNSSGGDDFDRRINNWKSAKPEETKKVKMDAKEFSRESGAWTKRRQKAKSETRNATNQKNLTLKEKEAIRNKIYSKHKANSEDYPKKFKEIKLDVKQKKAEVKKWMDAKPKRTYQGTSKEQLINSELKDVKKLISVAVPTNIVERLLSTQRAVTSMGITKANLKEELKKSFSFQTFFNAFNLNHSKYDNDSSVFQGAGVKINWIENGRKQSYVPTVDQLVTGISIIPEVMEMESTESILENFLDKSQKGTKETKVVKRDNIAKRF